MAERYTSEAIELPNAGPGAISRADLVFYGVDHSSSSFCARIFLDKPDADATTPIDDPSYAGSFSIFGHGGCFGGPGHCDVKERDEPFDLRPPHQLTPATRTVIVTDHIKRLLVEGSSDTFTVTVVAVVPGDESNDVLTLRHVRLLSYV